MAAVDQFPNAERVHGAFRGATEQAKWILLVALALEVGAAAIAAWRTLSPDSSWPAWGSLLLALAVVAGVVLRLWASSIGGYAERCRRLAIKSYGLGVDLTAKLTDSVISDEPSFSQWLATGLPAKSLQDYYECAAPPGKERVRELYAHGAYYSWRLLRVCWRIYLLGALVFGAAGFGVVYWLAANPSDLGFSGRMLDLVCSVIFVFFTAKAFEAAVKSRSGFVECRQLSDAFFDQSALGNLDELTAEYDIQRAGASAIPTSIYLLMRDRLQRDWASVRPAMV